MKLGSKEHNDLLDQFERDKRLVKAKPEREKDEDSQRRGNLYQNGEINRDFINYRLGYSFGKQMARPDMEPVPDGYYYDDDYSLRLEVSQQGRTLHFWGSDDGQPHRLPEGWQLMRPREVSDGEI